MRSWDELPSPRESSGQVCLGQSAVASAWIQGLEVAEGPTRRVADYLQQAGLRVEPYAVSAGQFSYGLLLFDRVTPDLLTFVRAASGSGARRVLALAPSRTALKRSDAWDLARAGACDVVSWPGTGNPALEIAARFERWRSVDELAGSSRVTQTLVGRSAAWQSVIREVVEVARFTNASVLITGESGTGKELVARVIHDLDSRPGKRDFVILDCTTVVPSLSGSEFFGHERGAFTGAISARDGAFELADRGTLFLDEVGELTVPLQAELLRVVQEQTFKRVGSNVWRQTNFRLVCATNRNLDQELADGSFRSDFYHRIAGWTVRLPSLRERTEDILPLFEHFYRQLRPGEEVPALDIAVRDLFMRRQYPGNVRDLRGLVFRVCHRHVGTGPVTVGDVPPGEGPAAGDGNDSWCDDAFERCIRRGIALGVSLRDISTAAAETAIRIAVADESGNLQRAARRLGVTDRALQMRRAKAPSRPLEPT
jgi:transcriptional regulator with GAF, ATPase, and Fis domain